MNILYRNYRNGDGDVYSAVEMRPCRRLVSIGIPVSRSNRGVVEYDYRKYDLPFPYVQIVEHAALNYGCVYSATFSNESVTVGGGVYSALLPNVHSYRHICFNPPHPLNIEEACHAFWNRSFKIDGRWICFSIFNDLRINGRRKFHFNWMNEGIVESAAQLHELFLTWQKLKEFLPTFTDRSLLRFGGVFCVPPELIKEWESKKPVNLPPELIKEWESKKS